MYGAAMACQYSLLTVGEVHHMIGVDERSRSGLRFETMEVDEQRLHLMVYR